MPALKMSPAARCALEDARRALGLDLAGRRWRLTTTGHTFAVLRVGAGRAEVLDGCCVRTMRLGLLREAHDAGILVEV